MLRAHLFGGLALSWDEEPLPTIPSRASRSLLAFLLTYRERPHTRDLLSGTFWPDLPDDLARRRLSHALWQIRRALADVQLPRGKEPGGPHTGEPLPLLVTEGDLVQLNPDPDLPLWVDIEEFAAGIAQAEHEELAGASCLLVLESCVDMYRGDFLAGYYDDWAVPEGERLRELLVQALDHLVEGYKSCAEYERALTYARRLAAEDPWREEAHREVMRLCHLLGRGTEALKQYESCRQILAEELGVEPSADTAALAAEIATRSGLPSPVLLPSGARVVGAPRLEQPDQLPLVGRRRELAELLRQVETAAGGRGGLTILYGEAGVGKSRLLRELAGNARWRRLAVAWGRCYELAAPPAYQPLVEALRTGLRILSGPMLEPLWRAELSRLLPELLHGTGDDLPPPLSPQEEQRRLLEAIARGFQALAATSPHLVLLEDLHWIDASSLEALRYLLPRLADAPLLIVATVRSEELAGLPADTLAAMESTRLARRLDLARLDLAHTGELVQRCLGMEQPPERFSARLHSVTEGNPFFLIETLWSLAEEGLLFRDATGAWSTPWDGSTADYGELPLPAGVVQSITRRLERLPARLGELLDLAAVIGRAVDFRVWLSASRRDEDTLLAAGDELCARKALVAAGMESHYHLGATSTRADYAFAHDQIRRVAYEQLAAPRRRVYHRRVAEALSDLAPGEPEPLAYHWTEAGVWDKAVTYHEQAADRAGAVYANADAVAHYSQALELLTRLPGPTDWARQYSLLLARERLLHRRGDRPAQTQDLADLEALAEQMDDVQRRAEVAFRRASYANAIGDFAAAREVAQRAVDQAAALGNLHLEAEGRLQWGMALRNLGDYQEAGRQFRRALSLGQIADLRQVQADSLRHAGVVSWYLGELTEAHACFEQGLVIMRELGNRPGEAGMMNNLGLVAANRGRYLQARDYFQRVLQINRETGDRVSESLVLGNLGSLLAELGFTNEAIAHHEQALQLCRSIGNRQTEAVQLGNLSLLWHRLGDRETALDYGQKVLQLGQEMGEPMAQAYGWTYTAHALLDLGQPQKAAAAYQEALSLRRQLRQTVLALDTLAGLARVALAVGDVAQALDHVNAILAHSETGALAGADEPLRASLTCYRVLCAATSEAARAEEVLNGAHRLLQEQAAGIEEPATRRSFLENVPAHREIISAFQERQAARRPAGPEREPEAADLPADSERTITALVPRSDAPLGRPLREDEYIPITWTVSAAEDQVISGKVTRRHHRLLRLLAEARAQGAAPTHQHLADALEVTRRTIERDVAALQKDYAELPPTRGKASAE